MNNNLTNLYIPKNLNEHNMIRIEYKNFPSILEKKVLGKYMEKGTSKDAMNAPKTNLIFLV